MMLHTRHLTGSLVLAAATGLVLPPSLPVDPMDSGRRTLRADSEPRLVVILVVDQMRADYLERYGTLFDGGLRRLMREGAWFSNAAYPYLNTVTCAGHSTIGTGSFPYRHGMILNGWYDRETGTSPFCTDDPTVQDVSYSGLPPAQGDSAKRLMMPALGEQIAARDGRSVSLSLKPRSAIPLAGHKADAVIWFDERGGWSTSTAYSREPIPFLKQFVEANPLSADYDKTWTRTRDVTAYRNGDDERGEGTPSGWSRTFPHPLGTPGGKPDATFYARWQRSPFADEYLGRMAAAAVDALKLGHNGATDFLGVSFSSLDLVGHAFGPRSHEVQDMLVRLDGTIARLLDHLDRTVGAGKYVLAMSADHGVAEIPDQIGRGGRQASRDVSEALNRALAPVLGSARHVLSTAYTDVYLSAAARDQIKKNAKVRGIAREALSNLPGIERVFQGDELTAASARSSSDAVLRAAALSYFPGRSGDLIIVPKENWLLSTSVTTHGTQQPYDQRVPLIFFGASIKSGTYQNAATPADLVPTLAAAVGIRIAKGDGHVLDEALAQAAMRSRLLIDKP